MCSVLTVRHGPAVYMCFGFFYYCRMLMLIFRYDVVCESGIGIFIYASLPPNCRRTCEQINPPGQMSHSAHVCAGLLLCQPDACFDLLKWVHSTKNIQKLS